MRTFSTLLHFVLVFCFAFGSVAIAKDTFRILFLTDVHVVPGNEHDTAMEKVVEEIASQKDSYDLAVVNGDICDMGSDVELFRCKELFDRMQLEYLIIPGNHETTWSESACQTFNKIWGNDRFECRIGRFYLIGFNTGPYMKMGYGHVKAEDLHWLDEKLKENSDPDTTVLVFSHYPLKDELKNWADVTAILKKYNVAAVFCGHWHNLNKFNFDTIPGLMGRPLLFKNDTPPGYNVIEIKGNRLSFIPRELDNPEGEPFASFEIGDPKTLDGIESDTLPPSLGGDLPENVHVRLVRVDEASIFGGLAIHGDRLVYGNSIGKVKACQLVFDSEGKANLTDQWNLSLGHSIYSTPMLTETRLIIGDPNNQLCGLDPWNGSTVWTIPATTPVTNNGILQNGFLYMGLGRDEFCKIDPETGEKIWSYRGVEGRFQAAPTVAYDSIVFGAWDRKIYCLDETTGKERWIFAVDRPNNLFSPGNVVPVVSPTQVVWVAPDRTLRSNDLHDGRLLWETKDYKVREAMGASSDGKTAYAKTMEGHVIAVSAVSREKVELLWDCDVEIAYDHVACPLFLHEKILYYGSAEGIVAAIDVTSGKKRWSYRCGNSAVNGFCLDEKGNVWFSLIEGKIYSVSTNSP